LCSRLVTNLESNGRLELNVFLPVFTDVMGRGYRVN